MWPVYFLFTIQDVAPFLAAVRVLFPAKSLFVWKSPMPYEPHGGGIFVAKPFRKPYEPCRGGIFVHLYHFNKHAVPMGLDQHPGRLCYKYAAPLGLKLDDREGFL